MDQSLLPVTETKELISFLKNYEGKDILKVLHGNPFFEANLTQEEKDFVFLLLQLRHLLVK